MYVCFCERGDPSQSRRSIVVYVPIPFHVFFPLPFLRIGDGKGGKKRMGKKDIRAEKEKKGDGG